MYTTKEKKKTNLASANISPNGIKSGLASTKTPRPDGSGHKIQLQKEGDDEDDDDEEEDDDDGETIMLWDVNVDHSRFSRDFCGDVGGGYGECNPMTQYMVVTDRGFYSPHFNFRWKSQVDTVDEFSGYAGIGWRRLRRMNCEGLRYDPPRRRSERNAYIQRCFNPDPKTEGTRFFRGIYHSNDYWNWTNHVFQATDPDLNEAFHRVIEGQMKKNKTNSKKK